MAKKIVDRSNRKGWFKYIKLLMTGRYKRPEFIYLGKEFQQGSIIVSNHEGTDAPLSLELYCDHPIRFWGASEMNSGVVAMYKYQSRVYYHQRKHWNLHLARLFCLIASPLTNIFYKGLNLISTYRDIRFVRTIKASIAAIKQGESVVVFPEDATNGYQDELQGFFPGFVMLAEMCYRKGIDVPIYVTYFRRKELKYIIDAPVYYSELARDGAKRDEIAKRLLDRCNELGRMTFDTPVAAAQAQDSKEKEQALRKRA